MDDGGKTTEALLDEVHALRAQLTAAEREHQIVVAGLWEAHLAEEARWRRRVESLEAKLAEPGAEADLLESERASGKVCWPRFRVRRKSCRQSTKN